MYKKIKLFFFFIFKSIEIRLHNLLQKILGNDKYIKKYGYHKALVVIDLVKNLDIKIKYSEHSTYIHISIHNYSLANAYRLYIKNYLPKLYEKHIGMEYYYRLRDDLLFKLHYDHLHLLKSEMHIDTSYMSKTVIKYSVRIDMYMKENTVKKIIKKLHKEMISELKKEELNLM